MSLISGQIIHNDRYRIVSQLGQGGMGAVYRVWDLSLNMPVAIKENLDASPEAQKQFVREAQMLARLSHPHLPRVIDYFFIASQGQYLVMDFVEGVDLEALLKRQGVLQQAQVIPWVIHICDALNYLHSQPQPIIHRDIKPGNIKICPDGRAMLVDFGIAKVYDPNLATTIGAKAVTPGYSPPEQYGGGKTDARSDIYALGATLYHLLTGKRPPESVLIVVGGNNLPAPRTVNNQVSPLVEQAILKCMEIEADRRYQSVISLRAALVQPVSPEMVVGMTRVAAPAPYQAQPQPPTPVPAQPQVPASRPPSQPPVQAHAPARIPSTPPVAYTLPPVTPGSSVMPAAASVPHVAPAVKPPVRKAGFRDLLVVAMGLLFGLIAMGIAAGASSVSTGAVILLYLGVCAFVCFISYLLVNYQRKRNLPRKGRYFQLENFELWLGFFISSGFTLFFIPFGLYFLCAVVGYIILDRGKKP